MLLVDSNERKSLSPTSLDRNIFSQTDCNYSMDDFMTAMSSASGSVSFDSTMPSFSCAESLGRPGDFPGQASGYLATMMMNPVVGGSEQNMELQGLQLQHVEDRNFGETKSDINVMDMSSGNEEQTLQINWDAYMRNCQNNMAPPFFFIGRTANTVEVPGLNPGMKLEAIDKNNPQSFCVATVIQVLGHRVRVRYDGYGRDGGNDLWCNFQADELHPIGWCAQNGFPLQPPHGIKCTLEEWRTFLTQTLTGALAAPRELFRKEHFQPRVHGFKVGMKLEVIHPSKPSVICPATVVKSLGPYYFVVATDYIQELPGMTFCCHGDSGGIFPAGWCLKNGVELTIPTNYKKKPFSWEKYMYNSRATFAPHHLFKKARAHKFKPGFKLEAVDLEQPSTIRIATVTNVMGRVLQLFFDGQSRFQFVECDSQDIYPIGWCKKTGHPLHTNFGKMPSKTKFESPEILDGRLKLTSFAEVISRKNAAAKANEGTPTSTAASPFPRKPGVVRHLLKSRSVSSEENCRSFFSPLTPPTAAVVVNTEETKDDKTDKLQPLSPSDDEDDLSDDDGNGSERFYHNKNQIFFNKSCCCGPLLNPDQVKLLPDATEPDKVSTVIRAGLEKVAKCAKDPVKVMGLLQEGSGVKVVLKHNGKVLRKAISRVDSRPKLERYLKRFCRRLVCCEYFLSLTPILSPCPDKCKADEQGNLEGPKGLKAKRSREYFETKHLGIEKKKRGRKSKSDLAASEAAAQRAAAGIVTTVFHKGDSVPLPNLDLPVTAIADHLRNTATKILNQNTAISVSVSDNRILPKPGPSSSTAILTNTVPFSNTNMTPSSTHGPPTYGQPRLLPSPITSPLGGTSTAAGPNASPVHSPQAAVNTSIQSAEMQLTQPIKKTVLTSMPVPLRPKTSITHAPIPITALQGATLKYPVINAAKKPLFPQPTAGDETNPTPGSAKPVFRLNPPTFHAPPTPSPGSSTQAPNQPPFSPRFVAVRAGANYRFALPVTTSSQHVLPTSSTPGRTGPPPLIPAPTALNTALRNVSQAMIRAKIVTAAPNVCVTERGTFVTTQMKNGVHTATGTPNVNPVVGQSPDANALMNKMFSVVHDGNKAPVIKDENKIPVSKDGSNAYGYKVPVGKSGRPAKGAQVTKDSAKNTSKGASGHKVSLNLGGAMGAVTTAVRSGLLTKEQYIPASESGSGISGKSISDGGGYSVTITESNLATTTTPSLDAVKETRHESGGEEPETKKGPYWLHRGRKKKKKARFTYVKGKKGKKKKEDEEDQIMDEQNDYGDEVNGTEVVLDEGDAIDLSAEATLRGGVLPKRGRPPKRVAGQEEELEQDPLFTRGAPPVATKRRKMSPTSLNAAMREVYPKAAPNHAQYTPPSSLAAPSIQTSAVTTAGDMTTTVTSQKTDLMKSVVPHAVQSSQHPSVKHRSPAGAVYKQLTPLNGLTPPSKKSRSMTSPTTTKSRGLTSPKSQAGSPGSRSQRSVASIGTNTSLPGCPGDACVDHPPDPRTWTVEQVAQYVESTDCKNYAKMFFDQEVDGESLLMLTRNALMQFTVMKLGPTLKMSNYIAQLRARAAAGLPTNR